MANIKVCLSFLGANLNVQDIKFRSDIKVELVQHVASDDSVVYSAKVSTLGERSLQESGDTENARGLINFLMKNRHGTPFEHNSMTFFVRAPIFVFRELMRHRIASYNEESGRYSQLQAEFYVPEPERKLVQVGKAGHYEFEAGSNSQYELVRNSIKASCAYAYECYQAMLDAGVAREVARMPLPVNIYSSAYVTINARSLMNLISLRTIHEGSFFPSYPQREIEMMAEQMEQMWSELMPITHEAFNKNGRVSP